MNIGNGRGVAAEHHFFLFSPIFLVQRHPEREPVAFTPGACFFLTRYLVSVASGHALLQQRGWRLEGGRSIRTAP